MSESVTNSRRGEAALTDRAVAKDASLSEEETTEPQSRTCVYCDAVVPADAKRCPECGRSLYRTCFCGNTLAVDERICPNCGADWSQSMRVARRRSRSRTPRSRRAARYALIGALSALGLAALLYLLISALAAAATGGNPPAGLTERAVVVYQWAVEAMLGVAAAIARHARLILTILIIAGAGAAIGLLTYFTKLGRGIIRSRHSSRRVRRKRRRA